MNSSKLLDILYAFEPAFQAHFMMILYLAGNSNLLTLFFGATILLLLTRN